MSVGVTWPTARLMAGGGGAAVAGVDSVKVMAVPVVEQAEHSKGEHEHGDHSSPEAAPAMMMMMMAALVAVA